MEDKQQLDVENRREHNSSRLQGISILVLSLLLSASVASVIYMSLRPAKLTNCDTTGVVSSRLPEEQIYQKPERQIYQKQRGTIDEAHMKFKGQDGSQMAEDVEYDEGRDLAIFHGTDGSFLVQDFEKGLNIAKDLGTGGCYVTPVGTAKETGQKLKNFLQNYHGEEIQNIEKTTYKTAVLPGFIEDTSFLPEEADTECAYFQWMSVVGEVSDKDSRELSRQKRACRWECNYVYSNGKWRLMCGMRCTF